MFECITQALLIFDPVKSPTEWHDKKSQRWSIFLRIVWFIVICISIGLMVDQLYDLTKLYLSRAKVTDLTLDNVSSQETFWMCFEGKIPYFKHNNYISQLMVSIKRSSVPATDAFRGYNPDNFVSRLVQIQNKNDDITNASQSRVTSVKDYLIQLSQSTVYPFPGNYWRKIRNMLVKLPTRTFRFSLYQCFSFNIPFPKTGGYTQYYIRKSSLSEIDSITILPGQNSYTSLWMKNYYSRQGLIAGRGNYPLQKDPLLNQQFYVTISRTKYTQQGGNECKAKNGEVYWSNCYIDCQNKKFSEKYSCTVIDYRDPSELPNNSTFCNFSHDLVESKSRNSRRYLRDNTPRLDTTIDECKKECKPLDDCINSDYQFKLQVAERMEKVIIDPNVLFSGPSKFVRIHLKFDKIQQSFKQYLAKNLDDYLADVGGVIGLYFGMSFVGLMNIIFYCFYTHLNLRDKRKLSAATKKFTDSQIKKFMFSQFRQLSQNTGSSDPEGIEMSNQNITENTFDSEFVEKLIIHRSLIKQMVNDDEY